MSLAQEPVVEKPPVSWLRRFRFPLIILFVTGGIFAIPWACRAFPDVCRTLQIDTEAALPVFMVTQWHVPALAVLLIGVWWLFFSGFRWVTRLAVVAAVIGLGVGFYFSVREVEFDKGQVGLVPRLHFVWQATPTDRL